jgi:tetratricopeptide (TPR) repeat protein
MSKIGFEQDLIRGIKKIISPNVQKDTEALSESASKAAAVLKRAFMALQDGEFDRADMFCEQALNYDPENARAYLGKLMAELKVKTQDKLAYCMTPFDTNRNYQKALHFGKGAWVTDLMDMADRAKKRSQEGIYSLASKKKLAECDDIQAKIDSVMQAIELFERIPEYKDSGAQIMECKTLKARYEDAMELRRRDKIKYDMMMERYNKNAKIIKGLWGFGVGLILLAAIAFFVIFTYVL